MEKFTNKIKKPNWLKEFDLISIGIVVIMITLFSC